MKFDRVPDWTGADFTVLNDEGDVVCCQVQDIEEGAVAAVLMDGEVSLQRFYSDRQGIVLVPAWPGREPVALQWADSDRIRILGRATHVIRALKKGTEDKEQQKNARRA